MLDSYFLHMNIQLSCQHLLGRSSFSLQLLLLFCQLSTCVYFGTLFCFMNSFVQLWKYHSHHQCGFSVFDFLLLPYCISSYYLDCFPFHINCRIGLLISHTKRKQRTTKKKTFRDIDRNFIPSIHKVEKKYFDSIEISYP